jgi:hypothetical protein
MAPVLRLGILLTAIALVFAQEDSTHIIKFKSSPFQRKKKNKERKEELYGPNHL